MSLEDAVVGLKAFKEVSQRMDKFWQDLNRAILLPRMDITKAKPPGIRIEGVSALRSLEELSLTCFRILWG
jgi:centromere/kinetochore protein ZW10